MLELLMCNFYIFSSSFLKKHYKPVTLLHTSARACNWLVFTSGTLMVLALVTVLVVVVKLMHVLIDGRIGITGITTTIEKQKYYHFSFRLLIENKYCNCIGVLQKYFALFHFDRGKIPNELKMTAKFAMNSSVI